MFRPATLLSAAMLAAVIASVPMGVSAQDRATVFTMSNGAGGNAILAFAQAGDGQLTFAGSFPTGGVGTGGGLGNQGSLVFDGEFLYAVNAGSNDLSVLRVDDDDLVLVDNIPSGGITPISVTVHRGLVYVLNAGSDNIAGFAVDADGMLTALPGSEHGLSGQGTGPAQIQFSKDGRVLIVTEKNTNSVVTFALDRNGIPVAQRTFLSPGATPFGFAVGKGRRVYVSEAAGGAALASSVTSWRLGRDAVLSVIAPSVATLQSAACWVALTPDGRFAYVTNTGSGTTSAFRIRGGQLELIDDGAPASSGPDSAPIDVIVTSDGRFVHVLGSGTATLTTFKVRRDGRLEFVAELPGLPDGANGLAGSD